MLLHEDEIRRALFAVIDVTEQDPFAAMARLGVSTIQPEEL